MSSSNLDDLIALLGPSEASKRRDRCLRLVEAVLKVLEIEKVKIGFVNYDVMHKLRQEINRLTDEKIEKILGEVKQIVYESKEDVTNRNREGTC